MKEHLFNFFFSRNKYDFFFEIFYTSLCAEPTYHGLWARSLVHVPVHGGRRPQRPRVAILVGERLEVEGSRFGGRVHFLAETQQVESGVGADLILHTWEKRGGRGALLDACLFVQNAKCNFFYLILFGRLVVFSHIMYYISVRIWNIDLIKHLV